MLVLRSSGWLAALGEGVREDLQPSPVHTMIGEAMLAGERSAHVCVFDFLCVSFRSWWMKDRYGYVTQP